MTVRRIGHCPKGHVASSPDNYNFLVVTGVEHARADEEEESRECRAG
jgi:hypothetical protein